MARLSSDVQHGGLYREHLQRTGPGGGAFSLFVLFPWVDETNWLLLPALCSVAQVVV